MISLTEIESYKYTTERDTSQGFYYGPSYLQVMIPMGPGIEYVPHWWSSCRACGKAAVLTRRELAIDSDCLGCGANWDSPDFDWTVDRSMRAWEVHQETLSTCYRLGGAEAVQAMAMELHREVLASKERHAEKVRQIRASIEAGAACDKT